MRPARRSTKLPLRPCSVPVREHLFDGHVAGGAGRAADGAEHLPLRRGLQVAVVLLVQQGTAQGGARRPGV